MIDIDATEVRMLPKTHIAFKDSEYIMAMNRKNTFLKNVIILITSVGFIIVVIHVMNEKAKNKFDTAQNI